MTKERKLAILMWQEIKGSITTELNPNFSIGRFKNTFCKLHDLHWRYNCWFCQYTHCCEQCPLNNCDTPDSAFMQVGNIYLSTKVRVEACDKIINALRGGLKDGAI